jgi:hypothetical protein
MNGEFPQFRKLSNEKSYYRIDSAQELTEIQRIGEKYTVHRLLARILPEKLLIADLLAADSGNYVKIGAEEFRQFEEYCEQKLTRV